MDERYLDLTQENLDQEHLCCAIADKKHQQGVDSKKAWLRKQLPLGHVFHKLDARGKVFIEYTPLQTAMVPIEGDNYLYIHCLWVSGSYKGKGHAARLLNRCLDEARAQGRAGVCVLSSAKKKPFLSDKKFFMKHGFQVADKLEGDYELLALSLNGSLPCFTDSARRMCIDSQDLTIYYSPQCPYIPDCLAQVARGLLTAQHPPSPGGRGKRGAGQGAALSLQQLGSVLPGQTADAASAKRHLSGKNAARRSITALCNIQKPSAGGRKALC